MNADRKRNVARRRKAQCAVARGEVDLAAFADKDEEWRKIGLASPARRALVNAGFTTMEQLKNKDRGRIAKLHGMGPNALLKLEAALKVRGMSLKAGK